MCGRYYVDDETTREIRKILENMDEKFLNNGRKTGEIFPTNIAPILVAQNKQVEPIPSIWGYPNFYNKSVMINARAETALEKKTFRESVLSRRCVIPATGFYEWDSNKTKHFFTNVDSNILYMAGIFNYYQNECRFVILTTGANESMDEIHHRMPLVLKEQEVDEWIMDNSSVGRILNQIPPLLKYA